MITSLFLSASLPETLESNRPCVCPSCIDRVSQNMFSPKVSTDQLRYGSDPLEETREVMLADPRKT